MGLCRQVVHLGGADIADDGHQRVEISQVAVVEEEVLAVGVPCREESAGGEGGRGVSVGVRRPSECAGGCGAMEINNYINK